MNVSQISTSISKLSSKVSLANKSLEEIVGIYDNNTDKQMAEFDPNNLTKKKKQPTWATFIPDRRSGQFKIHYGRGPALNACNGVRNYILYEWNEIVGQWAEVCRGEKRTVSYADRANRTCDSCHRNTAEIRADNPHAYGSLISEWIGKPSLRQALLCTECRRDIGATYNGRPIDERTL
jgi:hypothetical protein